MTYYKPNMLEEAFKILSDQQITIVAGGTDWYPASGENPVRGSFLDVSGIRELRDIESDSTGWRIGAAVRWSDITRANLPPLFDGLKQAARQVGSIQIQNAGTLAGNLCNASPAADGVPVLLTLDARIELASLHGCRQLPLDQFITGVRQTALCDSEMVTAIVIPVQDQAAFAHFTKLGARKSLVISIAMLAGLFSVGKDGRIMQARLAVGACSPVAKRLKRLEAALIGSSAKDVGLIDLVRTEYFDQLSPIDDIRAESAYRRDAVVEMTRRLIQQFTRRDERG